jgi:hypothetical protein
MNTMLHGIAMFSAGQAAIYYFAMAGLFEGNARPELGLISCLTISVVVWVALIWLNASATADSPKGVNND